MKKILLCLLVATAGCTHCLAQMDKTTVAANGFVSTGNDSMIGAFANFNVDLTEHMMISSITFVERFPEHKEGTVLQSYMGPAWRNKNATLGGGPYIGAINNRCASMEKTELTYGAWVFAQTKNGSWTLWGVWSPHGYFIELWKCLKTFNEQKSSKCELQGGITNLKSNFALTLRANLPRHNLYGFIGYSIKAYEQGEGHEEGTKMHLPKTMQTGAILEIGYSIQYKKKGTVESCEGCR